MLMLLHLSCVIA